MYLIAQIKVRLIVHRLSDANQTGLIASWLEQLSISVPALLEIASWLD